MTRAYAADTGRLDTLYARNAGYVTLQDFAFTFDVLGTLAAKKDEVLDRPRVARFEPDRKRDLSVSGSQVP